MKKVELNPMNRQILENQYLKKIREINGHIKANTEKYNNWDSVTDERLLKYGKDGYKERFIDYWYEERKRAVRVLNNQIRKGFIFE